MATSAAPKWDSTLPPLGSVRTYLGRHVTAKGDHPIACLLGGGNATDGQSALISPIDACDQREGFPPSLAHPLLRRHDLASATPPLELASDCARCANCRRCEAPPQNCDTCRAGRTDYAAEKWWSSPSSDGPRVPPLLHEPAVTHDQRLAGQGVGVGRREIEHRVCDVVGGRADSPSTVSFSMTVLTT